jgi:hypothetical protein
MYVTIQVSKVKVKAKWLRIYIINYIKSITYNYFARGYNNWNNNKKLAINNHFNYQYE